MQQKDQFNQPRVNWLNHGITIDSGGLNLGARAPQLPGETRPDAEIE